MQLFAGAIQHLINEKNSPLYRFAKEVKLESDYVSPYPKLMLTTAGL